MIAGVGTDIILVDRFKNVSHRFMERCFTESERKYLEGKSAASKAGIFAAKEAAVKTIGTGFKGFWPSEVEILHSADGQPLVNLLGTAAEIAEKMKIIKIWVSISHSETDAVAFAVAERLDAQ